MQTRLRSMQLSSVLRASVILVEAIHLHQRILSPPSDSSVSIERDHEIPCVPISTPRTAQGLVTENTCDNSHLFRLGCLDAVGEHGIVDAGMNFQAMIHAHERNKQTNKKTGEP